MAGSGEKGGRGIRNLVHLNVSLFETYTVDTNEFGRKQSAGITRKLLNHLTI